MARFDQMIISKNSNLKYIFELFEKNYLNAYKNIRGAGKTKILNYSAVTFKKWYYSAMINETILSPGNIFHSFSTDEKQHSLMAVNIKPVTAGYVLKGFDFDVNTYSINEHPIINDLRLLIDKFDPSLNLTEYNSLDKKTITELIDKTSIYDPFYIEYLAILAFKLKLLRKLPSLYVSQAQIAPNYQEFFELPTKEQLKKIIDVSIKIATKYLSGILPNGSCILNEKFIISILKKPMTTDDIFSKIYTSLGFDMKRIWDIFENPSDFDSDEADSMLISSTYFLGVLLDQWVFTLFGNYLKLIQPLYFFPFDFKSELNFTFDDILNESEMPPSLFSPCTFYGLTTLGDYFFNNGKRLHDDVNHICDKTDMDELCEVFLEELSNPFFAQLNRCDSFEFEKPDSDVYVMKLKQIMDKRYWKTIEIVGSSTLHDLHKTISNCFGFDYDCNYSFFLNGEHAFSEYTAPNTKNKKKKADRVNIDDLNFIEKQKFQYTSKLSRDFDIEIELLKIKEGISGTFYPRVVKRSKLMADEEDKLLF